MPMESDRVPLPPKKGDRGRLVADGDRSHGRKKGSGTAVLVGNAVGDVAACVVPERVVRYRSGWYAVAGLPLTARRTRRIRLATARRRERDRDCGTWALTSRGPTASRRTPSSREGRSWPSPPRRRGTPPPARTYQGVRGPWSGGCGLRFGALLLLPSTR